MLDGAFAVFVASIIIVGLRHEAWFDEGQAWLLARDNSLFGLLVHALHYEGTPGLWHMVLWVAIRCGLPYSGLHLISSALACGGAWLVMYRSPFPVSMRAGLIFSYFFGYQYSVVARSYCLDLLLLPLAACLYGRKLERPLLYCFVLGLCVNCNAQSFLIGAVLFLDFLWAARRESRWRETGAVQGMLAFLALACAAALQALPAPDTVTLSTQHSIFVPLRQLLEGLIDRRFFFRAEGLEAADMLVGFGLTLLALAPMVILIRRAGKGLLFAGMIGILMLFAWVEYASPWHAGIIFLVWVFCLWLSWEAKDRLLPGMRKWLTVALAGVLFVHVFYTLASWRRDMTELYSSGMRAAEVLKGYMNEGRSPTVAGMGFKAFSVQPWFGRNIFANYYEGAAVPSYYIWKKDQSLARLAKRDLWQEMVRSRRYDILLLSTYNLKSAGDLTGEIDVPGFVADAREAGYCVVSRIPAGMIWKGYTYESDNLVIFNRCAG